MTLWGFPWAWLALARRKRSRDCLPAGATLNAQSTTRHEARPGPKLAPSVHAGPLRAPQSRAREQTRGRKRSAWPCEKHVHFILESGSY